MGQLQHLPITSFGVTSFDHCSERAVISSLRDKLNEARANIEIEDNDTNVGTQMIVDMDFLQRSAGSYRMLAQEE